jgi:hypothetical protein
VCVEYLKGVLVMGLSFVTCVLLIVGQFSTVNKPVATFTVTKVVSAGDVNNHDGWMVLDTDIGVVLLTHGNEQGQVSGVTSQGYMLVDEAIRVLNDRYKTKIVKVFCCYPKRVAATSKTKVNIACPDHDDVVYLIAKAPKKGENYKFNVWLTDPE